MSHTEIIIPEDCLNIFEWKRCLCLKALNQTKTIREAANLLGVTERTVFNYIEQFEICKDGYGGVGGYYINDKYKVA